MKIWPHSPIHMLDQRGAYMVTGATYSKELFFNNSEKLELLHDVLIEKTETAGWQLQAWAVFPNHYHFLAKSPENAENLSLLIKTIHGASSRAINDMDETPGRKVWFQYWDTLITSQKSYFARLNYAHNNAVHHGIVTDAAQYKWCSASWFAKTANPSFRKTVASFKTDQLSIPDDF